MTGMIRPPNPPEIPYWDRPCVACRAEDRTMTNLECVTEIAATTGTPLEQAKVMFRKPEREFPLQTAWDVFKQEYMREAE